MKRAPPCCGVCGGQWLSPLFHLHPPPSPSRKAEGSLHSVGQEHKGGLCWQSPGWGPRVCGAGPQHPQQSSPPRCSQGQLPCPGGVTLGSVPCLSGGEGGWFCAGPRCPCR